MVGLLQLQVFIGKCRKRASLAVAIKMIPKKRISFVADRSESGLGPSTELIKREVEIMLSVSHVFYFIIFIF